MFSDKELSELSQVLLAQAIAMMSLVVACWAILGGDYAQSCLIGGLISLLPTWLFAWLVFYCRDDAVSADAFARAFFRSEGLKLLFAACLFSLVAQYFHPIWWVCLMSCLCTQLSLCVAPILWGEGQVA